jgi:hypothetical protein
MFWKLGPFPFSGGERETPTLLGPLERANLNHWTLPKGPSRVGVSIPSHENGNRSSFRNVEFSMCLEFRTMDKGHKPSNCVIHRRRNPLDSTSLFIDMIMLNADIL